MGTEHFTDNFFIKLATEDDKIAIESRLMEREVSTCLRIIPRIKMSLENKGPSLALPKVVYGSYDASGKGVLVAIKNNLLKEDIYEEISMKKMRRLLGSLSKYHAASMSYIRAIGNENFIKEFPHQDGSIFNNEEMFSHVNKTLKVI